MCAFHIRNREAKCQLKVTWSGTTLENCEHPVYLGTNVFPWTAAYPSRSMLRRQRLKFVQEITLSANGTSWGASPQTLKSTALALCYSTAEYACPVWERSAHAKKIDPALNATCRLITGCDWQPIHPSEYSPTRYNTQCSKYRRNASARLQTNGILYLVKCLQRVGLNPQLALFRVWHLQKKQRQSHFMEGKACQAGMSWPSGLVHWTQVLMLSECGFKSRPGRSRRLCPWAP